MSKQSDSFYDKFSFIYPLVDFFLSPQKKVLFDEINLLANGDLLEIGVGNGAHFHLYHTHRIVGIDTSSAMLEAARKKLRSNIRLIKMDGNTLEFGDNTFDYIVLSHVIAVVDNPEILLCEVWRVLKPTGKVFILNHFTPNNYLQYVDRAFSLVSKYLHFNSTFFLHGIAALKKFRVLKEVGFGLGNYFKLLICEKSEKK